MATFAVPATKRDSLHKSGVSINQTVLELLLIMAEN